MAGIDKNTLLLIHGGEIIDSSNYKVPITNNGVETSFNYTHFGGGALYFDGAAKLTINLSTLNLDMNSNWTMEFWEYTPTTQGIKAAVFCIPNGNKGFVLYSPQNGYVRVFAGQGGSWAVISPSTIGNFKTSQWIHRAVCKSGTNVYAFENGTLISTLTFSGTLQTPENYFYIGYRDTTSNYGYYSGYLQEIRISDVARWTSDFTPPTEPYTPDISGYCKIDGVWKSIDKLYIKESGTWKQASLLKNKNNNTWV